MTGTGSVQAAAMRPEEAVSFPCPALGQTSSASSSFWRRRCFDFPVKIRIRNGVVVYEENVGVALDCAHPPFVDTWYTVDLQAPVATQDRFWSVEPGACLGGWQASRNPPVPACWTFRHTSGCRLLRASSRSRNSTVTPAGESDVSSGLPRRRRVSRQACPGDSTSLTVPADLLNEN